MQKLNANFYVLLGDGECAEGSIWEAAALASKLSVDNLIAIVDANRLGQSGESLHGHKVNQWKRKWSAFGWKVIVIDGHNIFKLMDAFLAARKSKRPESPARQVLYMRKGDGMTGKKRQWP